MLCVTPSLQNQVISGHPLRSSDQRTFWGIALNLYFNVRFVNTSGKRWKGKHFTSYEKAHREHWNEPWCLYIVISLLITCNYNLKLKTCTIKFPNFINFAQTFVKSGFDFRYSLLSYGLLFNFVLLTFEFLDIKDMKILLVLSTFACRFCLTVLSKHRIFHQATDPWSSFLFSFFSYPTFYRSSAHTHTLISWNNLLCGQK